MDITDPPTTGAAHGTTEEMMISLNTMTGSFEVESRPFGKNAKDNFPNVERTGTWQWAEVALMIEAGVNLSSPQEHKALVVSTRLVAVTVTSIPPFTEHEDGNTDIRETSGV
jgi:hypothetical protein